MRGAAPPTRPGYVHEHMAKKRRALRISAACSEGMAARMGATTCQASEASAARLSSSAAASAAELLPVGLSVAAAEGALSAGHHSCAVAAL